MRTFIHNRSQQHNARYVRCYEYVMRQPISRVGCVKGYGRVGKESEAADGALLDDAAARRSSKRGAEAEELRAINSEDGGENACRETTCV